MRFTEARPTYEHLVRIDVFDNGGSRYYCSCGNFENTYGPADIISSSDWAEYTKHANLKDDCNYCRCGNPSYDEFKKRNLGNYRVDKDKAKYICVPCFEDNHDFCHEI